MANYVVTFDLRKRYEPADYERVETAIRALDKQAVKLLYTVWYLKSGLDLKGVLAALGKSLDGDDGLLVVDAKNAISRKSIGKSWDAVLARWNT